MNVAEVIVKALYDGGVRVAYGVPGEENTAMMLALQASDIEVVLTRHEQAAAFMASVYGRLTGTPAMCFATLGPGATNLVTGVADAMLDLVPLIVITGQGSRDRIGKSESHQAIDLEALFQPVTKLSRRLMHREEAGIAVIEALRVARAPKVGAVHLTLPEDLAGEEANAPETETPPAMESAVIPQALTKAIQSLKKAEHPLIVAGAGVLRSGATDTVREFVDATGIPLTSTFMAKGILDVDHPLHLHCIGQPFRDHIDAAVDEADLILAIGFDPVELPPGAITSDGTIPVVHVGEVAATLDHDWIVRADVPGDVARNLRGIQAGLTGTRWEMSAAACAVHRQIQEQRKWVHGTSEPESLHPADVLRCLEQSMTEKSLVLSGVGTHKMEVGRYLAAQTTGQIIIPNGLAGMGLALPGAIAAAHKKSNDRVFAVCGDGEFLMNVQDMETAKRLGVSLTVLLWEDGGYGLIRAKQQDDTGQNTDLGFGNPNWEDLARAFDWIHHEVASIEKLGEVLQETKDGGLHLVSLKIDYSGALKRDDAQANGEAA